MKTEVSHTGLQEWRGASFLVTVRHLSIITRHYHHLVTPTLEAIVIVIIWFFITAEKFEIVFLCAWRHFFKSNGSILWRREKNTRSTFEICSKLIEHSTTIEASSNWCSSSRLEQSPPRSLSRLTFCWCEKSESSHFFFDICLLSECDEEEELRLKRIITEFIREQRRQRELFVSNARESIYRNFFRTFPQFDIDISPPFSQSFWQNNVHISPPSSPRGSQNNNNNNDNNNDNLIESQKPHHTSTSKKRKIEIASDESIAQTHEIEETENKEIEEKEDEGDNPHQKKRKKDKWFILSLQKECVYWTSVLFVTLSCQTYKYSFPLFWECSQSFESVTDTTASTVTKPHKLWKNTYYKYTFFYIIKLKQNKWAIGSMIYCLLSLLPVETAKIWFLWNELMSFVTFFFAN